MELIKIIERDGRQLVSGRELHEFLEIRTKYEDWFRRMVEYGFEEAIDFIRVAQKRATNNLKNPVTTVIDHAISIDMAKEISMIQRTEKGKIARQYFINCEKKLKEVKKLSPMELMELQFIALKEQKEKIAQVENRVDKLEEDMPLLQIDCKEIQALVRKKGIEALGGYRSIAYNDNSLRGKVYSDIQQQIRREFGVVRYEAIKRSQLEMAKEIIINYKAPLVLENEIKLLNDQE
ncbi:ORF6C domain-containing protein [uncultured Clostridium sp.]|jgi:anti-repressor protein|uniref:ORF6C domain-containing protein n=1 Tax=uncultured Clostridium sp. TaxID=59620 RepID=UPI002672EA4F|nr:ORF6C domain-containing protein [uncultured Clostridium sp.]